MTKFCRLPYKPRFPCLRIGTKQGKLSGPLAGANQKKGIDSWRK